jgi:hypothetical protein
MLQYKIFDGTIAEIEKALNKWAASLVQGVSITAGVLTRIEGDQYFKEMAYLLPVRANGIAVPTPIARNVN